MLLKISRGNRYSAVTVNTLEGSQLKWAEGSRFYKIDKYGYESLAEALVSDLEGYIEDLPHVDYYHELKTVNGVKRQVCWSENCIGVDESETTFYDVLVKCGVWGKLQDCNGIDAVNLIVDTVDKYMKRGDCREYLSKLIFLDAITLNPDRHLRNMSIIQDSNGDRRFMPIWDNGLCLLANTRDYPLSMDWKSAMYLVYSQPFHSDYIRQCSYFRDCDKLRIRYKDFMEKLDAIESDLDSYLYYGNDVFKRMCKVLRFRLRKLEGIAWERL